MFHVLCWSRLALAVSVCARQLAPTAPSKTFAGECGSRARPHVRKKHTLKDANTSRHCTNTRSANMRSANPNHEHARTHVQAMLNWGRGAVALLPPGFRTRRRWILNASSAGLVPKCLVLRAVFWLVITGGVQWVGLYYISNCNPVDES